MLKKFPKNNYFLSYLITLLFTFILEYIMFKFSYMSFTLYIPALVIESILLANIFMITFNPEFNSKKYTKIIFIIYSIIFCFIILYIEDVISTYLLFSKYSINFNIYQIVPNYYNMLVYGHCIYYKKIEFYKFISWVLVIVGYTIYLKLREGAKA